MRASWRAFVGLLAGFAVAAGCDWRPFDTLQNEAPVLSVGPPAGYPSSNDFGGLVLPVAPPAAGPAAAWFLASGVNETALSVVTLTPTGGASASLVTSASLDDLTGYPVTAMAEIPGTGQALLGAPTTSGGRLLTIDLATTTVTPFESAALLEYTESNYGLGVAAGNLGGAAATPDLVALSALSLHVFIDESTTDLSPTTTDLTSCPIGLLPTLPPHERINRAILIANLTGATPVIAVGTPAPTGAGSVSFFSVNATAGTVSCLFALSAPVATDSTFGLAMATGDFNADGVPDLLVGAPPAHVYLYKGPLAAGAVPIAIPAPVPGGDFGAALATLNLDGKPGDEALIGDSGATVNGAVDAGDVIIYTGPTLGTVVMPTLVTSALADNDPSSSEAYGTSVAALPFCAMPPCGGVLPRAPLVGAPGKIFAYFDLGPTDLRAKQ